MNEMQFANIAFALLNSLLFIIVLYFLSLKFNWYAEYFWVFPSSIFGIYLLWIIWPFKQMFYHFRMSLMQHFLKNFWYFGPHAVTFRTFYLTTMFTSFTKPMQSLIMSGCLILSESVRINNVNTDCSRKTLLCKIVLLAPTVIRLLQSINKFYYFNFKMFPHGYNTLKFSCGIYAVVVGFWYASNKASLLHFVLANIVAKSFSLYWELIIDYGFGNVNSKHIFLRDKILFRVSYYWFAIVFNILNSLLWLTAIYHLPLSEEVNVLLFSLIEIFRRFVWGTIRLENEHLNNPEKYRAILDIPQLPLD